MNTNKSDDESRLLIQNQYFLNESSLAQYIDWDALARISFVNCNFEKVFLGGKVFGSCSFNKCKFEGTRFFKSNLDLILGDDVKIWKSNQWIEVKDFSEKDLYE